MRKVKKVVSFFAVVVVVFGSLFVSWAAEEISKTNNQVLAYQTVSIRPAVALSGTEEQGLEKILRPDMIRYYESIRKIDSSLWGKKKDASAVISRPTTTPSTTNTETQGLEKILTPEMIKEYESIRKVDKSLWGKRKDSQSTTKSAEKTEKRPSVKIDATIAACVKTAIEEKDTTLKAALTAHNTAIFSAIDVREACQKAAIDQSSADSQQEANKLCISTYQTSARSAMVALNEAKETNWKAFHEDLKACRGSETSADATTQPITLNDGEVVTNPDQIVTSE